MRFLILFFALSLFSNQMALAQKRVALLIANSTYAQADDLPKAAVDMAALSAKLSSLGFETTEVADAGRRDFNRSLLTITSKIGKGDTALVYFAGHGLKLGGENYLLPTDIEVPEGADADYLRYEAIALYDLIGRLGKSGAEKTVLLLDASRSNPFPALDPQNAGGLAAITAPEGSFVMFSAGVGETSIDVLSDTDLTDTSLFARTLLKKLNEPDLELRQMMSSLSVSVRDLARSSDHVQVPVYFDNLPGDLFLANKPTPAITQTPIATTPFGEGDMHADFQLTKSVNTPEAYRAFLKRYANQQDALPVVLATQLLRDLDTKENSTIAAPDAADRREIIRQTQVALNARNCNAGSPDGVSGRRTRAAFRAFIDQSGIALRPTDLGTLQGLNAVSAAQGKVCATVVVTAPKTPKKTSKASSGGGGVSYNLSGNWVGKASGCTHRADLRATFRSIGGGKYRAKTYTVGRSSDRSPRGQVRVRGGRITGEMMSEEDHISWNARFTSRNRFTGRDSLGCNFIYRRTQ